MFIALELSLVNYLHFYTRMLRSQAFYLISLDCFFLSMHPLLSSFASFMEVVALQQCFVPHQEHGRAKPLVGTSWQRALLSSGWLSTWKMWLK